MKFWVFGEYQGEFSEDSAWALFLSSLDEPRAPKSYFVTGGKHVRATRAKVSLSRRHRILRRNSIRHWLILRGCGLGFVALSYSDVTPDKFLGFKFSGIASFPIWYLNHGRLALKKLGYRSDSYWGNLFKFSVHSGDAKAYLQNQGFLGSQISIDSFLPRDQYLAQAAIAKKGEEPGDRFYLWFLTWREYGRNSVEHKIFTRDMKLVLEDKRLHEALEGRRTNIIIVSHKMGVLETDLAPGSPITFQMPTRVELRELVARSQGVITDFSSIGFEAALVGTPTFGFAVDSESYLRKRQLYVSRKEFKRYINSSIDSLIAFLIDPETNKTNFFSSRLPVTVRLNELAEGGYTREILQKALNIWENRLLFVGYDFTGIGGTVSATKALAEGLRDRGYLVILMGTKVELRTIDPPAVWVRGGYSVKSKSPFELLKRVVPFSRHWVSWKDEAKKHVRPWGVRRLIRDLRDFDGAVVVSSRETLIPLVNRHAVAKRAHVMHLPAAAARAAQSERSSSKTAKQNDLYFHVTKANLDCLQQLGILPRGRHLLLGNAARASFYKQPPRKDADPAKLTIGAFFRFDEMRQLAIEYAMELGRQFRDSATPAKLVLFGRGPLLNHAMDQLVDAGLENFVELRGPTTEPAKQMNKLDAVIELSDIHSFGMSLLEAGLLNVPCLVARSKVSEEVLGIDHPYFFESMDEALGLINKLVTNYDPDQSRRATLVRRYSQAAVSRRFLDALGLPRRLA